MNFMTRSRWFALVLLVAGLMGCGGCLKIDATLSLNRDGSGSLRAVYGMPAFLIKQLEVTRQWTRSLELAEGLSNSVPLPAPDIPMVFDEERLNVKFKRMAADGITLESLKTRDQGGWKYVDFMVKFNRLEMLAKQSFLKECGLAFKAMGDESFKLSISLPESGATSSANLGAPDALAKLTPFLNGFRVVFRVDLPGDIRNSTSVMSDNRRATWEWDFDKDVHVLDRLSRDKMVVVFDASLARIKEFEKPAGSIVLITR